MFSAFEGKKSIAFLYYVVVDKWVRTFVETANFIELNGPDHVKVFYCIAERQQQRINKIPTRRNIFNFVICYPELNAYQSLHMTFRYKPRGVNLQMFAQRILNEIVGSMTAFLDDKQFAGFFCKCN